MVAIDKICRPRRNVGWRHNRVQVLRRQSLIEANACRLVESERGIVGGAAEEARILRAIRICRVKAIRQTENVLVE